MRSLEARYPDTKPDPAQDFLCMSREEYITETQRLVMSPLAKWLEPVDILSMCSCYNYQACETDDYDTTQAARFIRNLVSSMISKLPGFDKAPWEYHPPQAQDAA